MFRITKVNGYRINFVLNDHHYSLSEISSYEEDEGSVLRRKEDRSLICSFQRCSVYNIISPFLLTHKHGSTYSQRFNLCKMERFFSDIIDSKQYEETDEYKVMTMLSARRRLEYHSLCIADIFKRLETSCEDEFQSMHTIMRYFDSQKDNVEHGSRLYNSLLVAYKALNNQMAIKNAIGYYISEPSSIDRACEFIRIISRIYGEISV